PVAARIVLTGFSGRRAAPPEALRADLAPGDPRVSVASSPLEALGIALDGRTPVTCVAGSIALIGEILAHAAEQPDFFAVWGRADSSGAVAGAAPLSAP